MDFEQVISQRKALMDQNAKTFESVPKLFSETGLPPTPARSRKMSFPMPPSMPALPAATIKARQHHQLLGELAVEATSAIPSVLPDFTASPLSVLNDRVLWLVIAEADAGTEFRSSPFTIPGCSEAACLQLRRPSKTALSKDCWK